MWRLRDIWRTRKFYRYDGSLLLFCYRTIWPMWPGCRWNQIASRSSSRWDRGKLTFEEIQNMSVIRSTFKKKNVITFLNRLNFSTAFSTNAVSIFHAIGLKKISRVEMSMRYLIRFESGVTPDALQSVEQPVSTPFTSEHSYGKSNWYDVYFHHTFKILAALHDRMTQCRYHEPLRSFQLDKRPESWYEVNIMENGREALEQVNDHLGRCILRNS